MVKYNGIKIVSKVKVTNKNELAIVYTPGVAASCLKIKENSEKSFEYQKSLERAIFLKSTLNIDAYPFEISSKLPEKIKFIVENIEPSFGAIDLSLIENDVKNIDFNVNIPVLKGKADNLKEFFLCISKNVFMFDYDKLEGNTNEKSLQLREMAGC